MLGYERTAHLTFLLQNKDREQVKILSGLRGGGKTALLFRFMEELTRMGVPESRFFYINLASPENAKGLTAHTLFRRIMTRFADREPAYIFLDEAPALPGIEKLVDHLFRIRNFDVYIAGSAMERTLGELRRLLPGRCLVRGVYPLSFTETLTAAKETPTPETLIRYVSASSMPGVWNEKDMLSQLDTIMSAALFRDACAGGNIRQGLLVKLLSLLSARLGESLPLATLAALAGRTGRPLMEKTLRAYLARLAECGLLFMLPEETLEETKGEAKTFRFYFPDGAMARLFAAPDALPLRLMKNAVCAELFRRTESVAAAPAVDFLSREGSLETLWQYIPDAEAEDAEAKCAALAAAPAQYKKCILTFTPEVFPAKDGVLALDILKWFLAASAK